MLRIDETVLQLGLEAVVLLRGEIAVPRGVDEGAGGPRGVVEQGLVPARCGVVDVDGRRGGLNGREAVVVVERVEEFQMQDAGDAGRGLAGDAARLAVDGVVVGLGPAAGAREDAHAVWAQRVQLADVAAERDGLEVGVAGNEEEAVPGLEQVGRAGLRIGASEE